jgi:hypothetical protein
MNLSGVLPQTSGRARSAALRAAAPSTARKPSGFLEINCRRNCCGSQTRAPSPALAGIFALLIVWDAVPAFSDELGAQRPPTAAPLVSHEAGSAGQEKPVGTVTITNVDDWFVQSDASCVLASYAIVANYFTGQPVSAYFEGYCRHFGIFYAGAVDAERKYASHFDAEWKKRKCMGYEVILDLHSNSTEKCFVEARRRFDAHFYLESSKHLEELEQVLSTREALLNITYRVMDDTHSVTVMRDGPRMMVRDTTRKGLYPITSLRKLDPLVDCVLYVRK